LDHAIHNGNDTPVAEICKGETKNSILLWYGATTHNNSGHVVVAISAGMLLRL